MSLDLQKISRQIAERLRDYATDNGFAPVLSGELRKSHVAMDHGSTDAILTANTPYARAVHDGRPAITIKPKGRKALMWAGGAHPMREVHQPARAGNPWLKRAVQALEADGADFLAPQLGADVAAELTTALRKHGLNVSVSKS